MNFDVLEEFGLQFREENIVIAMRKSCHAASQCECLLAILCSHGAPGVMLKGSSECMLTLNMGLVVHGVTSRWLLATGLVVSVLGLSAGVGLPDVSSNTLL